MKTHTILLIAMFLASCVGSPQSIQQNNSCCQIESNVRLDSIPRTAREYKERGKAKSANGDKFGAIEDYTRAIMVDPTYDTAYYNRGVVKYDIGDKQGELADYDKTLDINSKYLKAYFNRGVLKYEMGDNDGAIEDYRLAAKTCTPDADVYNNLGRILYDLERFKESAEAYGEGITHFPEDYKLYYGRGLARESIGDRKGACEDWIKSSELGCFEANVMLPLCEDCETTNKSK